jgi:hypothetical protein
MSINLLASKTIDIQMPAFIYSTGLDKCVNGDIHIEGRYTRLFRKIKFDGFIEINGERYELVNFRSSINAGCDLVIVLASVISKTEYIKIGLTAYLHIKQNIIKGTLYESDGIYSSTMDFAAPAKNIQEAERIENILDPECFGRNFISGQRKFCNNTN